MERVPFCVLHRTGYDPDRLYFRITGQDFHVDKKFLKADEFFVKPYTTKVVRFLLL